MKTKANIKKPAIPVNVNKVTSGLYHKNFSIAFMNLHLALTENQFRNFNTNLIGKPNN